MLQTRHATWSGIWLGLSPKKSEAGSRLIGRKAVWPNLVTFWDFQQKAWKRKSWVFFIKIRKRQERIHNKGNWGNRNSKGSSRG